MKIYLKDTPIIQYKNVPNARIVAISDLHYTASLGEDFLNSIRDKIDSLSPSFICFLGDLADDNSHEVVDWLNDLAKIAPVYFVLGNHDFTRYITYLDTVEKSPLSRKTLDEIKNIKNLNVLEDGRVVYNNGYAFFGLPYYDVCDTDKFIKKVNKYDINLKSSYYNTMLVHNPWIINEREFKKLKDGYCNTDLILSGHTHNGVVPHFIDKHLPGNYGLYAPSLKMFPQMARGHMEDANYDGIIVPALRTIPDDIKHNQLINKVLYPPAISLVRIQKKE